MAEVPAVPMSIIVSMSDAAIEPGWKGRLDAEGPTTVPEPSTRPSDHAQWDEIHGRWIEWNEDAGEWQPVPDSSEDPTDQG